MPDDIVTPSGVIATPASTPANQPPPVATDDDPIVKLSPAQMKQRLDETRGSERKAMLKEFGFESIEAGKRALQALKELQDSQLTEQQKIVKERDEYKKQADSLRPKAERTAAKLAALVNAQFDALPEAQRNAIDKVAEGDPDKRLELIEVFRAAGALGQATATEHPAVPKPLSTAAPTNAPRPGGARTKFDDWQDMAGRNQVAGDLFYQNNMHEIERSRPPA